MFTFLVHSYLRICELQGVSVCDFLSRVAISILIDIDLTNECVCFQRSTSNAPMPRCTLATPATGNIEESSLCSVTRDSSAARRPSSDVWCAMPSSSTSTVYWGITTFTCSTWRIRLWARRTPLDRQNDRGSRELSHGETPDIFESLNSFEFETQQKYKIYALIPSRE